MRLRLLVVLVLVLAFAYGRAEDEETPEVEDEIKVVEEELDTALTMEEIAKLPSKTLRRMLADKGQECKGCTEK